MVLSHNKGVAVTISTQTSVQGSTQHHSQTRVKGESNPCSQPHGPQRLSSASGSPSLSAFVQFPSCSQGLEEPWSIYSERTRELEGTCFSGLAGVGGLIPWTLSPTTQPLLGVLTPPPLWPQIQNLGLFPIHGVMMKITVPIATRGGNRLLLLRDFLTDQVPMPGGSVWGGDKQTPGVPSSPQNSAPPPRPRAGWAFPGQRRREDGSGC